MQRVGFRIKRKTFHDMQLLAAQCWWCQHAGFEADGIDDESVTFPLADRMTEVAWLQVGRVAIHVEMNPAAEIVETVVHVDDALAFWRGGLRDSVNRPVESPVIDNAGGFA